MRARVGILRALIAVLWAGLLVVPVGVDRGMGPQPASVGEALGELARGRLGVGILSALVAGGELLGPAVVRVVLVVVASVAFWLAGKIRTVQPSAPAKPDRRPCPYCGAWASTALRDCPSCGRSLREI